jgi:acyl carrier protein
MRDDVSSIIFDAIAEYNRTAPADKQLEQVEETILFGERGRLDSLGLVSFLLGLEERLQVAYGRPFPLTDERAMSQEHSPFRTVKTLASYVELSLDDTDNA